MPLPVVCWVLAAAAASTPGLSGAGNARCAAEGGVFCSATAGCIAEPFPQACSHTCELSELGAATPPLFPCDMQNETQKETCLPLKQCSTPAPIWVSHTVSLSESALTPRTLLFTMTERPPPRPASYTLYSTRFNTLFTVTLRQQAFTPSTSSRSSSTPPPPTELWFRGHRIPSGNVSEDFMLQLYGALAQEGFQAVLAITPRPGPQGTRSALGSSESNPPPKLAGGLAMQDMHLRFEKCILSGTVCKAGWVFHTAEAVRLEVMTPMVCSDDPMHVLRKPCSALLALGCAGAVPIHEYNFLFIQMSRSGVPLNEVCPASCGRCPDIPLLPAHPPQQDACLSASSIARCVGHLRVVGCPTSRYPSASDPCYHVLYCTEVQAFHRTVCSPLDHHRAYCGEAQAEAREAAAGGYVPQCQVGLQRWEPMQHDPAAGTVWCVNPLRGTPRTGTLLPESRRGELMCHIPAAGPLSNLGTLRTLLAQPPVFYMHRLYNLSITVALTDASGEWTPDLRARLLACMPVEIEGASLSVGGAGAVPSAGAVNFTAGFGYADINAVAYPTKNLLKPDGDSESRRPHRMIRFDIGTVARALSDQAWIDTVALELSAAAELRMSRNISKSPHFRMESARSVAYAVHSVIPGARPPGCVVAMHHKGDFTVRVASGGLRLGVPMQVVASESLKAAIPPEGLTWGIYEPRPDGACPLPDDNVYDPQAVGGQEACYGKPIGQPGRPSGCRAGDLSGSVLNFFGVSKELVGLPVEGWHSVAGKVLVVGTSPPICAVLRVGFAPEFANDGFVEENHRVVADFSDVAGGVQQAGLNLTGSVALRQVQTWGDTEVELTLRAERPLQYVQYHISWRHITDFAGGCLAGYDPDTDLYDPYAAGGAWVNAEEPRDAPQAAQSRRGAAGRAECLHMHPSADYVRAGCALGDLTPQLRQYRTVPSHATPHGAYPLVGVHPHLNLAGVDPSLRTTTRGLRGGHTLVLVGEGGKVLACAPLLTPQETAAPHTPPPQSDTQSWVWPVVAAACVTAIAASAFGIWKLSARTLSHDTSSGNDLGDTHTANTPQPDDGAP